jgi:hypothetical protein
MWTGKNKNQPVSGFFTKIAYDEVMIFILVKVSTLYRVRSVLSSEHIYEIRIKRKLFVFELHIPILTLRAKNDQDLQLECHK